MSSSTYGAIKLATAEDVGAILKKKMGTQTGYKPKEWADTINLLGKLPVRTASGTIAHFEDGTDDVPCVSVVANILPVQDLHGYANPWIGGTGKNLTQFFNDGKVPSISNGALVDYYGNRTDFIKVYPSTGYTLSAVSLSGTCYFFFYDENKDFISYQQGFIPMTRTTPSNCKYVMLRNDTALSSYEDVQFETGSTATSYEPYENICPISGHTECEVTQTGENLFDLDNLTGTGITIQNGEASGRAYDFSYDFNQDRIPMFVPPVQFTLKCTAYVEENTSGATTGLYFRIYYTDGTYSDLLFSNENTTATTNSITTTSGKIPKEIAISYSTGSNNVWHLTDIQLELGSTATTYEAYKSKTYTKALGQTVFGGTLDLVSGLLTINKVKEVRRWDSARSSGSSVGDYWRKSFELANATIASTTNTECSVALYYADYSSNTLHYYIDSSARLILFLPNDTADSYEFEICYPLATPIEAQLTPEEVRTFLEANNFFNDCGGDTEVEYRADMNLLLASLQGNRGLQMTRSASPVEEEQTEEVEENEDER